MSDQRGTEFGVATPKVTEPITLRDALLIATGVASVVYIYLCASGFAFSAGFWGYLGFDYAKLSGIEDFFAAGISRANFVTSILLFFLLGSFLVVSIGMRGTLKKDRPEGWFISRFFSFMSWITILLAVAMVPLMFWISYDGGSAYACEVARGDRSAMPFAFPTRAALKDGRTYNVIDSTHDYLLALSTAPRVRVPVVIRWDDVSELTGAAVSTSGEKLRNECWTPYLFFNDFFPGFRANTNSHRH